MSAKLNGPLSFPKTRGECVDGPRPCPWARCRYSLLADYEPNTHKVREHASPAASCALDVADRGRETSDKRLAKLIGRGLRTIERVTEETTDKIAALSTVDTKWREIVEAYETVAACLPKISSTDEPAACASDGGSDAEIRQGSSMTIPPNLICEINALLAACTPSEDDLTRLQTVAATGDVLRFNAERDRIRANSIEGTELDAFDINKRNPILASVMRGCGVTAAQVREYGPRAFNAEPKLRDLINDSSARGERMGTGS